MPSILNNTCELPLAGQSVTFRELRAVEGIEFLKLLSKYASGLKAGPGDDFTTRLTEVIVGAEEVSTYLVLKSAGKPREWLETISATEFIDALQVAIDLNISETFIKKAQGVAASIKSKMPGATPNGNLQEVSSS